MQMHTANNGPKIKLTEIVLHLCERFSTSSHQDNMFGFPSVNLTYTPFIKYFKGEAEKCFRLKSVDNKRNGKQMSQHWHPVSAVGCSPSLFAHPGAAGKAISVSQEHWRIYCKSTVKPSEEGGEMVAFKSQTFLSIQGYEQNGAVVAVRLMCTGHHWSTLTRVVWWLEDEKIIVEIQM